ncbi:hypothetical protein MBLNU230_g0938t1 [Neophaeotheca triangularis]
MFGSHMATMDPVTMEAPHLEARQYYYGNRNRSSWSNWVRWLVLGLVIAGAILVFFLFSCITARRRRKRGYQPYRGTGWTLGRTPPGHGPATYNASPYYGNQQSHGTTHAQPYYNNSNNPPPPAYPGPNNGAAQSYYGNNDMELQQPNNTYQGYNRGNSDYSAPPGPPPNHKDGIIR